MSGNSIEAFDDEDYVTNSKIVIKDNHPSIVSRCSPQKFNTHVIISKRSFSNHNNQGGIDDNMTNMYSVISNYMQQPALLISKTYI